MLEITIEKGELWDEKNQVFINIKDQTLQLEHSLVSLHKWESKWHKPFLYNLEKGKLTFEETADYVRCMTLTKNVDPNVYRGLSNKNIQEINKYMADPMTATTFSKVASGPKNKEILTAEIIYYYMVAFSIPSEYAKWHLNQLLTLIKVCDVKNSPPKKMSQRDILNRNSALNEARRKQLNSKG